MAFPDSLNEFPNYKLHPVSRWVDYIELKCLKSIDHEVSLADILDQFRDETLHRTNGTPEHSSEFDKLVDRFRYYFSVIQSRINSANGFYPYEYVDSHTIKLKDIITDNIMFYVFLLCSSNVRFFDGTTSYNLTKSFEEISLIFASKVFPNFSSEIFGTSRGAITSFTGNQRERLRVLSQRLNCEPTTALLEDERFNASGGDYGIDIVTYLRLDCNSHIPIAFGQCACSYDDWEDKQFEISNEKFSSIFSTLPPYMRLMFVPFYYRKADNSWENKSGLITCLFDRYRMIELAKFDRTITESIQENSIIQTIRGLFE